MEEYYSQPLMLGDIFKKKPLKKIDEMQSIAHNINLILTTQYGENRYDESYGCEIWEDDFSNIDNNNAWKAKISVAVMETLSIHEPRLIAVQVKTDIGQKEFVSGAENQIHSIKRKVELIVSGKLTRTNQEVNFRHTLFISPLATDME
jgi:hypothetical protein